MWGNVFYATLERIWLAITKILWLLLLARYIGPAGVGIFALAIATVSLSASFCSIGVEVSNNYYATQGGEVIPALLGNSALFCLVSGGAVSLMVAGLVEVLRGSVFSSLPSSYTIWIAVAIFFQCASNLTFGIGLGLGQFRQRTIGVFLQWIIFLGSVGTLAFLGKLRVDLLLPLYILGVVAASTYWLIAILKISGLRLRTDWAVFRQQLRYGLRAYFYNLCHFVNYRLDFFFVAAFYDAATVGYYATATHIAEGLTYLPAIFSNTMLTQTASDAKRGGRVDHHGAYWLVACVLAPAAVLLMIIANPLISTLFSARLLPAAPALRLLLPGTCCLGLGIVASYQLFGLGRFSEPSIAAAAGMVCTVVLDLLLIPRWGIRGAAVASTFAYLMFAVIAFYFLTRQLRISVVELLVPTWGGVTREMRRVGLIKG
jgi:O-antigen/teichoic acid export membrane protein